jgi:uncharacterized Zn finger protein
LRDSNDAEMKLSGSRKSLQSIDALGEEGVTLLPTEAEDMVSSHCPCPWSGRRRG